MQDAINFDSRPVRSACRACSAGLHVLSIHDVGSNHKRIGGGGEGDPGQDRSPVRGGAKDGAGN